MKFNELVKKIMEDCVAGGIGSVFNAGPINPGQFGNQFPSQNDNAYAPGDARYPFATKKKKKKKKIKIQCRQLSESVSDFDKAEIGNIIEFYESAVIRKMVGWKYGVIVKINRDYKNSNLILSFRVRNALGSDANSQYIVYTHEIKRLFPPEITTENIGILDI